MSIKIYEILYTIQGESSFAGYPCVLIRLSGCNLRCSYCDTSFAYSNGSYMSINEIIKTLKSYDCSLIEVTGGEPLMQEQTPLLIKKLLNLDYKVLLETNGSYSIDSVDRRCIKIIDIKCPSSGEHNKNYFENFNKLNEFDELKFVIGDKTDYEYAKEIIKKFQLSKKNTVLFSPIFGILELERLAKWILSDNLNVKIQAQLHKIIWKQNNKFSSH